MTRRTLAVINAKGGTGKSTIATHLASAMAESGLKTALAEADSQKSALTWLKRRPGKAAPIAGLDWRRNIGGVPDSVQRVVIDCPAQIRSARTREIVRMADAIAVPTQASFFDEHATLRFLNRIAEIRKIRKGRIPVLIVASRVRLNSREARMLETVMLGNGYGVAARIPERALYPRLASEGLSVFDMSSRTALKEQEHWLDLLVALEALWAGIPAGKEPAVAEQPDLHM